MMQKADQFKSVALLGSDEECISKEVEMASTKFVGNMYGKTNCTLLNALRCQKARKRNICGKKLPPIKTLLVCTSFALLISCL